MGRPHIEPFCDRDVHFKNMTLPGMGKGFRYKMLSLDNETGACSMTVQLDGGYKRPPGFSWSEYELMVTEGEIQFGNKTYRRGHYFYVPAGYSMSSLKSKDGALLLLMFNTGGPSHVESRSHHQQCNPALYHDVSSFDDIPWAGGGVTSPTVASGCMVKLLNYNPNSMALTFLYCMTPDFWQDNISYHDCAEESYHLWGTSWMMQFGEIPTGGYFWRPAYINHGAFASNLGCIALGRTDSKLFNHFHYNPWTTPKENQLRSAARLQRRDPILYNWMVSTSHNHPHGPEDFEKTSPLMGKRKIKVPDDYSLTDNPGHSFDREMKYDEHAPEHIHDDDSHHHHHGDHHDHDHSDGHDHGHTHD